MLYFLKFFGKCFLKWFKNGLKAQKLLLPLQGVWSLHAKVENLISSIKSSSSEVGRDA